MSARNKTKAKIHMSKPELPAFLQRMKEQIVANEDAERKEQSQKKRKSGTSKPGDDEDDPTIVRIGDEDLTEEEYKRLKLSLDAQYRLDSDEVKDKAIELDIDAIIQNKTEIKVTKEDAKADSKSSAPSNSQHPVKSKTKADTSRKQLSYGYSSDEEE